MEKHYYIKSVCDGKTNLLDDDWGFYPVETIKVARFYVSAEKAENEINRICNQEPTHMSDGTIRPAADIYRIGGLCNDKHRCNIRLSVIEIDIDNCTMKEGFFVEAETSFESPTIRIICNGFTNQLD